MHCPEGIRDEGFLVTSIVGDYRHEERAFDRHQMGAVDREFPLEPKVALEPLLCMAGDQRDEEGAIAYLAPDPLIPHVSAPKLALVKPNLGAAGAEGRSNARSSDGVLRCIAQEHSSPRQ